MDLDERRDLELLAREGEVVAELRPVEDANDEQGGARPHHLGLPKLVLVDHEIFSQHRKARRVARGAEVLHRSFEELLVRQDRDRPGAPFLVGEGLLCRVEVRLEDALYGGGALDLGDDRDGAFLAQIERGHRRGGPRLGLELGDLALALRSLELGPLRRDDLVEDHRSRKF